MVNLCSMSIVFPCSNNKQYYYIYQKIVNLPKNIFTDLLHPEQSAVSVHHDEPKPVVSQQGCESLSVEQRGVDWLERFEVDVSSVSWARGLS